MKQPLAQAAGFTNAMANHGRCAMRNSKLRSFVEREMFQQGQNGAVRLIRFGPGVVVDETNRIELTPRNFNDKMSAISMSLSCGYRRCQSRQK
jgi:hypothetical protein